MEVVEARSDLLSNREVLELLKNYTSKKQTNLATILYETTSYLESSPAATTSLSKISEFLSAIEERKYNLSAMEKIQLVNLRPENETELHLIVDNIEEKFSEQEREHLLRLVQSMIEQSANRVDHSKKKVKV